MQTESKLLFNWSRQQPDLCHQFDSYKYIIKLGDRVWGIRPDDVDRSNSAMLLDALIEIASKQGLFYMMENHVNGTFSCLLMQRDGRYVQMSGETQSIAFLSCYLEWLKVSPVDRVA